MSFETFLGFRYLKARQRSTFISVITLISIVGVTLGVATLSVVLSVMNGFQQELINKVIGANSHAILFRYGSDFQDHAELRKRLVKIEGIQSAAPIVLGEVMLSAGDRMVGVGMKGIDLQATSHLRSLQRAHYKKKGTLQHLLPSGPNKIPGIAIGKSLAAKLRVKQGETINMISPGSLFGLHRRPQATHRTFRVAYIFRFGMYQYDSKFCFVALQQAQRFLGLKGVSGMELLVDDIHQMGSIKRRTIKTLGGWPYRIQDWREMNRNLFKAIQENKLALGLVLLFIILVASLNIAGTLVLMVLEKAKDIAILRAMGASKRSIMKIFMTYGLYIGSLGTMAGILLGLLLCQAANHIGIQLDAEIYFISHLPVKIEPLEFVLVATCSLLISFIATIYPAIQATRQKPVEVLRYE